MIELIGGYDAARRLILRAIEARQARRHGEQGAARAARRGDLRRRGARGVDVAFEASVGGGIPILRSLREGLAANRIESVHGIVNGTTNYVLTRDGADRRAVRGGAEARAGARLRRGRPELRRRRHRRRAQAHAARRDGVRRGAHASRRSRPRASAGITPLDFEAAEEFGYRIKLLGDREAPRRRRGRERIEARVHPTMIPRDEPAREAWTAR